MQDAEQQASAEETGVIETPPDEVSEETTAPEIEDKARKMGWRPLDEFHGNPDEWRDAEEFVRRGEEFLPVVKSRLEKSEAKLQDYETRFEQLDQQRKQDFERLSKMNEISRKRERERIERQYEEAGRKAVEFADPEEYDRIQARRKEDLEAFDKAAAPVEPDPEPEKKPDDKPKLDARSQAFMDENAHWFGDDGNKAMTMRALAELEEIDAEHPAMSMPDKLVEMKRRTVQRYPKAFGVKSNGGSPDVLDGSRRATGATNSLVKRLPLEARAQAEKEIKEGNFKTLDEYAKIYFEDEAQS